MEFIPSYIVLHHSVTDPRAEVSDIKKAHLERGMDDIAYHFIIDSNGEIHIGRPTTIPGAHAKGLNQESLGICCLGDYSETLPSPRVLETLIQLLTDLRFTYEIAPEKIIGHRDVVKITAEGTQTSCPGGTLYEKLEYLRARSEPPKNITIKSKLDVDASAYQAETRIHSLLKKHRCFILIKGSVKNTGRRDWSLRENETHPIRIGLILFRKTNGSMEILAEQRYDLPHGYLASGRETEFSFEINPTLLPHGEVGVIISPVRERDFWFHQRGSEAAHADFLVEEPKGTPIAKKIRNFFLPAKSSEVKILFICPTLPFFDRDTGGRRLLQILRMLREANFSVVFAYESTGGLENIDTYIKALEALSIRTVYGPLSLIAESKPGDFSACVLGWHECAQRYIDIIEDLLPGTKIIIDTVDIHWVRELRGVQAGEIHTSAEDITLHKQKEIEVYLRADEVWTVSQDDRNALLLEIPDSQTKVIPIFTEAKMSTSSDNTDDAIIFVGSFSHPPNESAARWGYEIVQQYRLRSGKHCKFYIIGSNPPPSLTAFHNGIDTFVTGYVQNLSDFYNRAKAFLAPMKYGAGVKGKITDASAAGLPIITSPIGNEGLNLVHKKEAWICETTEQFVDALEEVYSEKQHLKQIAASGLQKILSTTSTHRASISLLTAFQPRSVIISIVTYNKRSLLERCLTTLFESTDFPLYRVAITSNGCTDGTEELIQKFQERYPDKIHYRYNTENKFFIIPNNEIIRAYPTSDIILLNNDTEILSPRWISELQDAAYTSSHIAASGPLVINPDGRVSEFGGKINRDGTGINLGRNLTIDSIAKQFQYTGYASGCCLYLRRDIIEQYGMLLESLHPMYYEDVEWQYRMHTFGLKTLLNPRVRILHREGSTAGTDLKSGSKQYQEINRKKFLTAFEGIELESLDE